MTQVALQKALESCRSEFLGVSIARRGKTTVGELWLTLATWKKLSPDRYHVRRLGAVRPAKYPIDWDAQTIYVVSYSLTASKQAPC